MTDLETQLATYQQAYKELEAEAQRLTDERHTVMQKRAYYRIEIERTLDALAQENNT